MKLISTSACPHDCPSTCTLDIEHDDNSIFKINGNKENSYTKGVICAKVSRYRERTHNKNRLLYPLKRIGEGKDSASLAKFLLSNDSSWITGQVIAVDGGRSKLS